MEKTVKTRFRNTSQGYVGCVIYKPNGNEHGVSVEPEGTIELSQEEIELTARAPREASKNPFLPQPYEIRDPATDEVMDSGSRPLLVVDEEERFTPTVGSRKNGEETGIPASPKTGASRRKRAPAKKAA
jgi:hypothetical protein